MGSYKLPPISQLNLRSSGSGNNGDDTRSIGTASIITVSSFTHSTSGSLTKSVSSASKSPSSGDSASQPPGSPQCGWQPPIISPHASINYAGPSSTILPIMEDNGEAAVMSSPQQKIRHSRPYLETLECSASSQSYQSSALIDQQQSRNHQSYPIQQQQRQALHQQEGRIVVCGMPWTYTGEVNHMNIPEGIGSTRYIDGIVAEGIWKNGQIAEIETEQDESSSSTNSDDTGSSSSTSSEHLEEEDDDVHDDVNDDCNAHGNDNDEEASNAIYVRVVMAMEGRW